MCRKPGQVEVTASAGTCQLWKAYGGSLGCVEDSSDKAEALLVRLHHVAQSHAAVTMADNAPQYKEADIEQNPPAVHHRQNGTPTKSSYSRQHGESKHSSPGNDTKKRKRDASEPSNDAVVISRHSSQQPTSSSTYQAAQLSPPTAPQVSSSSVGKSPSTASVHPCDGELQASHAVSHDQQSSMPAEMETGTVDDSMVWRSKEKLAACLSCDLCNGVLKDPVTAPECMHSFCRDCIDQHVLFGGTKNTCPVCKAAGLQTVFGPQPFQHGKLQYDPMLADMIRKLFPRADVEKSIQERHDAEAKLRASLPNKKQKIGAKTPTPNAPIPSSGPSPAATVADKSRPPNQTLQPSHISPPQSQAAFASIARVGLFLQTLEANVRLSLPYLWVQQSMPLNSLSAYVRSQLQLDDAMHQLRLECEGVLLQSTATLQSVSQQWYRTHPANHLVVIQISVEDATLLADGHLE